MRCYKIMKNILRQAKKTLYDPIRNRVKKFKEHVAYGCFLLQKNQRFYRDLSLKGDSKKSLKKLLYVGSGRSALEYKNHNLEGVEILTVNNSHKAFEGRVDYYLCSTDFPNKNKPEPSKYGELVLKPKYFYEVLSHARYFKLPFRPNVGKTIFLDGLYWALAKGFDEIFLLGFDHDYNPNRVKKWDGKHIGNEEKLKEMFSGQNEEPDAFYGQNTPDPLRHGKHNLSQMFEDAQNHASIYGCKVINLSTRKSGIEVFERRDRLS